MNTSLFNNKIPGLGYTTEYISPQEQRELLEIIDRQTWLTELKRRVQHYGYRYNYKSRQVTASPLFIGLLPEWVMPLAERLRREQLVNRLPDQLIVNEYLPGQGIASHIDCITCFSGAIVSLSLGSSCMMIFTNSESGVQVPMLLEARSLLVMQKEARYKWKHSIPQRKTDLHDSGVITRTRRVSLTFRNIIL